MKNKLKKLGLLAVMLLAATFSQVGNMHNRQEFL
jgi:hypothetical protein